jgi:AcrR family transcriptional regulator
MARRPAPKPPGRYHHGELRRALLETALAVIERDGVSALSLRDLARRLGVSHAAPAHHFPDRTALLVEIAREGYERFGAALAAAAAAAPDDDARLAAVGRAYIAFALDHPATFRVMFGSEIAELGAPPPALVEASRRSYEILLRGVEAALDRLPPGRRPPAEAVAFAAWSGVHGAAMLWLDGPLRCGLPEAEARARFEAGLDFMFSPRPTELEGEPGVEGRAGAASGAPAAGRGAPRSRPARGSPSR